MSISVSDTIVFEAIAYQLKQQAPPAGSRLALYPCCESAGPAQIEAHVTNWLLLNELSYVARFRHLGERFEQLYKHLNFSGAYPGVSKMQLYKWLTCIYTNIELQEVEKGNTITEAQHDSMQFLQTLIIEVMQSIINSTTEYQQAEWDSFDNHSPLSVVKPKAKKEKKQANPHPDYFNHTLIAVFEISANVLHNDRQTGLAQFLQSYHINIENTAFLTITRARLKGACWEQQHH